MTRASGTLRRVIYALLVFCCLTLTTSVTAQASPDCYRLGVHVPPTTSHASLFHNLNVESFHPIGDMNGWYCLRFSTFEGAESALRALQTASGVFTVLESRPLPFVRKTVDPFLVNQYWLTQGSQNPTLSWPTIHADVVWNGGNEGAFSQVALIDDGVELNHPEFFQNANTIDSFDFVDNDADASPTSAVENHGTSMAGIIAAMRDNGEGIAGVAPQATITSLRALPQLGNDFVLASALSYRVHANDVYVTGFGFEDNGAFHAIEDAQISYGAIRTGINLGRSGNGCIYVWPAGNGRAKGDNSGYDGLANLPETIAVGAVNADGGRSSFSEDGPNILVVAQAGPNDVFTTDRLGLQGYNTGAGPLDAAYTASFGGTSASAAQVGGVVALMLEANPDLTWRDVQHILIRSVQNVRPQDPGWQTNGAGLRYNEGFGFGLLDAREAVDLAMRWRNVGPQARLNKGSQAGTTIPIPELGPGAATVNVDIDDHLFIEHVQVRLWIDHPEWASLSIRLVSPSGTESTLATPHNGANPTNDAFFFGSVVFWGEEANGTWLLEIDDHSAGFTGDVIEWELILSGSHNSFGTLGGDAPGLIPSNPELIGRGQVVELRGKNLSGASVILGLRTQEVIESRANLIKVRIDADAPLVRQDLEVFTNSGSDKRSVLVIEVEESPNLRGSGGGCSLAMDRPQRSFGILEIVLLVLFVACFVRRRADLSY